MVAQKHAGKTLIEIRCLEEGDIAHDANAAHGSKGYEHRYRRKPDQREGGKEAENKLAHEPIEIPDGPPTRINEISYEAVDEQEEAGHIGKINGIHENTRHGGNEQKRVLARKQLIGAHEHKRKEHGEIDEVRMTQNAPEQHIPAQHIAERAYERCSFALAATKTIERKGESR